MNITNDEGPTIQQSLHINIDNPSDQKRSSYIPKTSIKSPVYATPLEYSCWHKDWSKIFRCAFVGFIAMSILVAVLTIILASRKPNRKCGFNFRRSAERVAVYDSCPRQIATGTFNNDKHLDLVVANSGTDCVGIFIGYGNGTFANQMTYSTGLGSTPYSVAVGRFNNDTHLDIVVANYGTNSISVLLGHGNGSFANPITTMLGSGRPLAIVTANLDNDKLLDIAVANYGTSTVVILVGINDGSFRIDATYEMGYDSIPYSVAAAHFDRDGILDLAVLNYGTSELVLILRGGNDSFSMERFSTGVNSHPVSLLIEDFRNDGELDVVVANSETGNIIIFFRYTNGRFENVTKQSTDFSFRPQALVINKFNNDTQLNIVVSDTKHNRVLLLKGNTNGSFSLIMQYPTGYGSHPCSITVGDFDNDGRLDIAVVNNGTNNILVLTSFVIYPTITQTSYSTGRSSFPWLVAAADLNKDNYLDIVVPNVGTNTVSIIMNLKNGTFAEQQTYFMGDNTMPAFVAIGDLNRDDHSDIVVSLHWVGQVSILLGYGNGTFRHTYTCAIEASSRIYSGVLGDLNNDNNLDIIISHYDVGNVGIFFGYGDGTFTNVRFVLADGSIHPKYADVCDMNSDNILDIVVSDHKTGGITILLGYGNGFFKNPIYVSTDDDRLNAFTIGDLNGDNLLDIVYSDYVFSHVGVLFGRGNGSFANLTQYTTVPGSEPWFLALGYYNDDTLIDIVAGTAHDSSVHVFMGTGNGLFGTPVRLSTGYESNSWAVILADLDNDNQQDIVAANEVASNIVIFHVRNYYGTFLNEASYVTGSSQHSYSISVADLDNDQQLDDIVVANAGIDNVEVLFDFNGRAFNNATFFSTGHSAYPTGVTVVDINKDYLPDIAVINSWDDSMSIFLQLSDGSFSTNNIYSLGYASAPQSIIAGDFNNDGRLDIGIANEGTDNIAVFLAHDYVMFTKDVVYLPVVRSYPIYVATSDFNNDGQLDIAVVTTYYTNPAVFLGYGNGTFSKLITEIRYSTITQRSLIVGDFNNDNHLDIVIGTASDSSMSVFLGYGNGSFQSPIIYLTGESYGLYSMAIGDFNSDARLDIVITNIDTDNIWIFFGFGNGSFNRQIKYIMPSGSRPIWVAVKDLNKDSISDIIIANLYANNICILLGYGTGSFRNAVLLSTGLNSEPFSLDIGDLNNDNTLDIVVINQRSNSIGAFFGYGNGTFSSQKILATSSEFDLHSIVVHDVNNDAILDILITDCNRSNSSIGILYGYGDGNFTLPKIYPTGSTTRSRSITTGDFDNDGRIDLAVTYYYQDGIGIMLQEKTDIFDLPILFSTGRGSRPKSVSVGDFNSDTYLDIIVANSGSNNIGVLLGYGNGYFSEQLLYSAGAGSTPSSLTTGDFNKDEHLDIVVVNSAANNMGILLGYGNGLFGNISVISTGIGSSPSCVAVADLNHDNYLDVVVTNWGTNKIVIFLGTGNGIIFETKEYSLGYDTRPQSVSIGDINNDNLLDIVVAIDGPNYIEILLQTC